MKGHVFECNGETYLGCVESRFFGSNKPWPLKILQGDLCLLHHYDAGCLFGLWEAETDGGHNLVPKLWNGKFPYQVKVRLVTAKIAEVPKSVLSEFDVNPSVGRFDSALDKDFIEAIVKTMKKPHSRILIHRLCVESRFQLGFGDHSGTSHIPNVSNRVRRGLASHHEKPNVEIISPRFLSCANRVVYPKLVP